MNKLQDHQELYTKLQRNKLLKSNYFEQNPKTGACCIVWGYLLASIGTTIDWKIYHNENLEKNQNFILSYVEWQITTPLSFMKNGYDFAVTNIKMYTISKQFY